MPVQYKMGNAETSRVALDGPAGGCLGFSTFWLVGL